MRMIRFKLKHWAVVTGVLTLSTVGSLHASEPSTAGVVRISDNASRPMSNIQRTNYNPALAESDSTVAYETPVEAESVSFINSQSPFSHTGPEIRLSGNKILDWFTLKRIKSRSRRARRWREMQENWGSDYDDCACSNTNNMHERTKFFHAWNRCKYGYFYPTGCGGTGCPPVGFYNMVYAVDPYHHDQRDGQVYSAQGSGVPMAVPLAPNVRHTYNYGWGIPSSRLTPISRVAPQVRYINPQ